MKSLILALLLGAQTQVKGLCERHLIANDPWPFAELSNDELIHFYGKSPGIRDELLFRLRAGKLNGQEIDRALFLIYFGN